MARVTCFTGWRTTNDPKSVSYHRGIDIKPDIDGLLENQSDFYAPEDGVFWIFRSNTLTASENIILPPSVSENERTLKIDTYSSDVYGFVGVLLTRPDDPEE